MQFICASTSLNKNEIKNLNGGRIRGEKLLVAIEIELGQTMWIFGRLGNQWKSQVSPRHPEGLEPIVESGIEQELRYDIATATIPLLVPTFGPRGMLSFGARECPAMLYRWDSRLVQHVLWRREARTWRLRMQLLRAIGRNWSDAPTVAGLLAENLRIKSGSATREPLAMSLTRLVYALDKKTCDELNRAIKCSRS